MHMSSCLGGGHATAPVAVAGTKVPSLSSKRALLV